MERNLVCAILQLVSILTMFFGACLTSSALITFLGTFKAMKGFAGAGQTEAGIVETLIMFGVLSNSAIIAWGVVLYCGSPWVARMVGGR